MDKNKVIFERYKEAKTERQKYISAWTEVNQYINPISEVKSDFEDVSSNFQQKDIFINDPTAQISVQNSADYLLGILWGSGEGVFEIVPSQELIELIGDISGVKQYFSYITDFTAKQINNPDAGFLPSAISFLQDQVSYGTSGQGCFPNPDYTTRKSDNALLFNHYSITNCCVDEGKNGRVNVIFDVKNWRVSRIVQEFAFINEEIDKESFEKLPKEIKEAWNKGDYGRRFKLINCIMPNSDYLVGTIGVNGTKYKGVWFLENEEKVFFEEYYKELPVAIARLIKSSGHVYGLSPALLCLSSIRLLNLAVGEATESIEKMNRPARGAFAGSLVDGQIIDDSAGALTIFNGKAMTGEMPFFNISNVGDISPLVQLLIPKLEQDISNIFKIDKLLDFNNMTQMTATESMHRFSIRIKSIGAMISQLVNEWLNVIIRRAISVLDHLELLGVKPDSDEAKRLQEMGLTKLIVPVEVQMLKNNGKSWYDIKFKNEIQKFNNADLYENLGKFLNIYGAMVQFKPELMEAIKPYQLIDLLTKITNLENEDIVISEYKFKEALEASAQQQSQIAQMQAEQMQSQTIGNLAKAEKDAREQQSK